MPTLHLRFLAQDYMHKLISLLARFVPANFISPVKASWAQRIDSYADLPEVYTSFFAPLLSAGRDLPYTVLTPAYDVTSEKLVCALDSEVCVLEKNGDSFTAQRYPVDQIDYVETRTVLLDSSIKICGANCEGQAAASTFTFNAVTEYLFRPVVGQMRLAGAKPKGEVQCVELEKFDEWSQRSYKFMNYAKRTLLGGDEVVAALLQPEIQLGWFSWFGRTYYRALSPAHAVILTTRELIVIREEARQPGGDHYGAIWDYLPLAKISLSLLPKEKDLLALSILLPDGVRVELLFQATARLEIERLIGLQQELA